MRFPNNDRLWRIVQVLFLGGACTFVSIAALRAEHAACDLACAITYYTVWIGKQNDFTVVQLISMNFRIEPLQPNFTRLSGLLNA